MTLRRIILPDNHWRLTDNGRTIAEGQTSSPAETLDQLREAMRNAVATPQPEEQEKQECRDSR